MSLRQSQVEKVGCCSRSTDEEAFQSEKVEEKLIMTTVNSLCII